MKRIVTLLLAAGLVLGAAAGSQAADIKAKGNWTFTWQLGDNNLFEKNGDKFTAKQRLRTQIDVIASESLKGVLFLEMGDQNWGSSKDGASLGTDGKIVKADVSIAKNYLSMGEMQELNEIVTMYLDYATRQARRHIPMTMADWASKLDAFLQFNDAEILRDKGRVTAAIAKAFAESEFEQYRVIQDRLYQSDFDRLVASTEQKD